ncbi:MAG TPA: hypothetical protein VFO85_15375 [Vicinamibacteria bacterium]|nr:hypothetical protein [Vicinamibacteria bacterium]
MPPPEPDEDEDEGDVEAARREARLLAQLRLRRFTASPVTIHPFETATLSWDVGVPPSVSDEIAVTFSVAGAVVPATGTRPVSPLAAGAFLLEARSPNARRVLGHAIVNVDVTDCRFEVLQIRVLQELARRARELLRGAGSLTLRGDIALSARPPDGLLIEAPLRAAVPNFFDADVDVDVLLALSATSLPGGARVVSARVRSVSVDVIFHLAEHIFSGGSATAVQAIVQPLAAELIRSYVGPTLEQDTAAQLQAAVDFVLGGFRTTDPQKREHRLYSIATEPGFLAIVGCPVPPPPPPPPVIGGRTARGRRPRKAQLAASPGGGGRA